VERLRRHGVFFLPDGLFGSAMMVERGREREGDRERERERERCSKLKASWPTSCMCHGRLIRRWIF
jgi:hypothetical protein